MDVCGIRCPPSPEQSSTIMKQTHCEIIEHREVMSGAMELTARDPEIAATSRPGQFVNVLCGPCMDPILRRPFSIYRVDRVRGEFSLLYQLKGRGTVLLAQKAVGDVIDIVGPVGHPFEIDSSSKVQHFLVGGGCGIVPLLFLADTLNEEAGGPVEVLIGAQSAGAIMCEREFWDRGMSVELSTDDGTAGRHGFVTDLLAERLANMEPGMKPSIYACGPHQMLKRIARIAADHKAPCQVSLEAAMACGFGVCTGCVVKVKRSECPECGQVYCTECGGGDDWEYKRVCADGPVFYATELVWE